MTRLASASLALGLLLAACGTGERTGAETPTEAAGAMSGGQVGHPLEFTAATTTGAGFDGGELVGQDVVLWFWAPWCSVCRAEAPQVEAAAEQVAGEVAVVGVASSGTLEDMQAFIAETGADSFPHLADEPGDVWSRFGVVSQPTFVFVDDDGRTQSVRGGIAQAALVDAMRQLAEA